VKTMRYAKFCLLFAAVTLAASCASYRYTKQASDAVQTENWDAAVYFYMEALARDPGNLKLKMHLERARRRAAEEHFKRGKQLAEVGALRQAAGELQMAVQLDPTHQYAEAELRKVLRDLAVVSQEGGEAKLAAMKKAASEMKVKPPVLSPTSNEPISLVFPNQTKVKDIYKAIGDAFGINLLFDPKLKDNQITIELKNVTARQALESVMQAANHFYKVLDERTLIVIEDTPQNRRDYEDLVVKTFFLSNADVKDVNNMLRALIDARRISPNEQLNSIIIRDTADKVAIAERLINANDKAKAEVMVGIELIQVDSNKLRDIGMSLSSYSYPITFDPSPLTGVADKTRIPLPRLGDITRSMWGMVVPNVAVNLIKSAGEAETLAQPEMRITEGEKGNLVIGDRVPIPTTTFNTTQTIGGNIVPITAFQYQDVGIKITIEPRVHHNNEVTLKLEVEVSELGEYVEVSQGQRQPKIGTRTINTVIRLKNGETSLLAGLFRYRRSESNAGLPWFSDLPVIGGLFRSNRKEVSKQDLILTLTPHIIRNPDITEEDLAPVWVGTENRITIFGNSPRIRSPYAADGPFGGDPPPFGGYRFEETPVEEPPPTEPKSATQLIFPDGTRSSAGLGGTALPLREPSEKAAAVATATAGGGEAGASSPAPVAAAAATEVEAWTPTPLPEDTGGLARVVFYPARLAAVVGREAVLTVVLEPGEVGFSPPLHLAYDPARLEVLRIEGGELETFSGAARVGVSHTPAVGWVTASWQGTARATGTLLKLTVRPREVGELPVIFAGPAGSAVSRPATVVSLPAAGAGP